MHAKRVKATNVRSVIEALRGRIARREIPPGSKLGEQQLAQEFGVSRARIREALGVLEQRGLIERTPHRGAVVLRLDLTQVFDIYQVRESLEGLCVRLATLNVPPASWQDLVQRFGHPMQRCVKNNDLATYVSELEKMRQRFIQAAQNSVLAEMLDSIHEKTQAIIRRIIILPGRAEQGLKEHRAVLAAMRKGRAEEAERLQRENIRSAKEYLKRYESFVL